MPKINAIKMTETEQIKAAIFFKVLIMAKTHASKTHKKPIVCLGELKAVFAKFDHKLIKKEGLKDANSGI